MTPDGTAAVHDFMPVIEGAATGSAHAPGWCGTSGWSGVMRVRHPVIERASTTAASRTRWRLESGAVFRSKGLELTMHGIAPEISVGTDLTRSPDNSGLQ
jgi:hypothetical protein